MIKTIKTIGFTITIKSRDVDKLLAAIIVAMENSTIYITSAITKKLFTASVFLEASGDKQQVEAFREWAECFALTPSN